MAGCLVEDEGRVIPLLRLTFGPYAGAAAQNTQWELLDEVPVPLLWAILRATTVTLVPRLAAFFLAPILVAAGEIPDSEESYEVEENAPFFVEIETSDPDGSWVY